MESLSRPPHRRKHSSKNSFSSKNPYDDVFLSNVGKREALGAHEYAEIFAGSSSIPVLDLSGLDERVGPADCPSVKLDYNNIFGGFESDDVALSYEELLNGSAEKPKLRNTSTRGEESGSVHSSRKPKMSFEEASDKSADGVNKQFNMSFNKSSQRNNDESNGKMHIAHIHAVPGFIHFVDNNPRLQKTNDGKTVSRTWSFSAEVKGSNGKSGLNDKDSQEHEKSLNVEDFNLKPNFSKVTSFPLQSRTSDFVSKKDVLENIANDSWPPYFGDDFGENSVAAESAAAALKRAMDEAQESIRIAKMIMDRKKEGLRNEVKPRAQTRPNVFEKEDKVDNDSYGSRKTSTKKKIEELNDKFTESFSHDDTFVSAPPVEVKRVWENAEAAKEHRRAFSEGGKLFSLNVSQRESPYMDEKIELERTGKRVEAAEACNEGSEFSILVVKGCISANLLPSTSKLASDNGYLETVEDNLEEEEEVTISCTKEPERALDTSQRIVGEAEQWRPSHDHVKEPKVESILNTSERTLELDKVLGDNGNSLKNTQENEISEERENDMDYKGKEKLDEIHTVEHFTFLRPELDNFPEDLSNLAINETLAQIETERESETLSENKANGHIEETYDEEAYIWFESADRIKEAEEAESNEREPQPVVFQGKGVIERTLNESLELENDQPKQNLAVDRNEPELPEVVEPNNTEERHVNTSDGEIPETIITGTENCAKIQNITVIFDSAETNNRIEEKLNNLPCEEDAFEEHITDPVDLNSGSASTIFSEAQTHDNSTKISQNQEARSDFYLDSNSSEMHRVIESFKETDSASEAIESYSGTHKHIKAEPLVHLKDDNEYSRTETLRRVASEEILLSKKLHNVYNSHPPEGKMENAAVMDAGPREELPDVIDESGETSEIHDVVQESNTIGQSEIHSSNIHTSEFDLKNLEQVSEQTSESDRISTSTDENTDKASAQESEELAEGTIDKNPDCELLKDEVELNANERNPAEEQSEGLHSWSYIEPKERKKSMDKNNNENLIRTESTEAKDTKEMEKPVESENKNENIIKASTAEAKDTKANLQNSEHDNYQQRIEAIKRGREREKDRLAVERAIREARERAFAEARERAERAAVERAAAEARQRSMAGARDKFEKSSRVKQTVDKSSNEAKLRAERAAVEKATAEARERALEKAMSQKTTYTEGRTAEKVSGSSRNSGLKHSFSSSDLENGTESAQRRKARLERHQRIMERAAKALAEKNRRDLLVQKEQAERNRLAESLDAEIKRWVTGKEGNLRALLSTLQYILGPDSGWQPIPLTEIVTNAAVKKAYRKATLYVHPDKLQQRGASIQQKYLCEKVFDLLKAAWNRFNSDER